MSRNPRTGPAVFPPAQEGAWLQQAAQLHQAGRLAEAEQIYKRVVEVFPKSQDGWHLRGNLYFQAGQPDNARKFIKRAIKLAPKEGIFWSSLAVVEERAGNLKAAESAYAKAVKFAPDHAEAWNNFGTFMAAVGRREEAITAYGRAVELQPNYMQALYNLAVSLLNAGRSEESVQFFEQGLAVEPGHPELLINYGIALKRLRRYEGAEAAQLGVLEHMPENPGALTNLASLYFETNRLEEAAAMARRAIRQAPDLAEAWTNLGNSLSALDEYQEAEAAFLKALEIAPGHADAHGNLANLYKNTLRLEEAGQGYRKACELDRRNPRHPFQLALHHFIAGDLEAAWPLYETGFDCGERRPDRRAHPAERWKGQDLTGKCLHLWPEQGLGDELMALSLYEETRQRSGAENVVIECDPRLVPALERALPWAGIMPTGSFDESRADAQIPILSLGGVLRNTLADFPDHDGCLEPEAGLFEKWRKRMSDLGPGLKVGIAWTSGLVTPHRSRTLSQLSDWEKLLETDDVRFVCLQHGDRDGEIRAAEKKSGRSLHRWDDLDLRDDIEDMLALMSNLDLVISVGTSVSAMAGALGTKCWVLLYQPEWSQFGTEHLPFFPAQKIYGRDYRSSWREVLDRVADDLARLARPGPAG